MTLLPWKRTVREAVTQTSAFEELALPLLPSLYNVAFWLSRNATDAEDLVQETFLKALRGFASFEPGTQLQGMDLPHSEEHLPDLAHRAGGACARSRLKMSWTSAVSRGRHCIRRPRSTGRPRRSNLIRLGDRAALHAAMEKLSPPLLEVILLCDVEEMKYREIAAVLEIPIGTVMSRIARARAALRKTLQTQTGVAEGVPRMTDHLSPPDSERACRR